MTTDKLRIIQMGATGWGQTWLDRVSRARDWELAAIVSRDTEVLASECRRLGLPQSAGFVDFERAADAVEADAVLVVVPAELHLEVGRSALARGLHVLMEKPLTDSFDHSRLLVQEAEGANRLLMVSQNYRYRRGALKLAEIFSSGWLGAVHFARVEVRKELHFVLPDTPHGFHRYRYVRDAGVHHLDQIRACLGVEVGSVTAHSQNPAWSWFANAPMVSANLQLEGGGLVAFYGSWIHRGKQTTFDGDWHVECANGQLMWSGNQILVRPADPLQSIQMDGFVERGDGWMEAILDERASEDRTRVLEVFATAVREGTEPWSSGRDNLRTAALTFATECATSTGEAVDVRSFAYGFGVEPGTLW